MRRGCISFGETKCDGCQRVVPYAERYVILEGDDEPGIGDRKKVRYCTKCAMQKGYAHHKEEKGEKVLTLFPSPDASISIKQE